VVPQNKGENNGNFCDPNDHGCALLLCFSRSINSCMSYRTIFQIQTGDYEFNNASEFLQQLETFGFDLYGAMGTAHAQGIIKESAIDQVAADRFQISVTWANEQQFYEFLVSESGRNAFAYAANIAWKITIIEKTQLAD